MGVAFDLKLGGLDFETVTVELDSWASHLTLTGLGLLDSWSLPGCLNW